MFVRICRGMCFVLCQTNIFFLAAARHVKTERLWNKIANVVFHFFFLVDDQLLKKVTTVLSLAELTLAQ